MVSYTVVSVSFFLAPLRSLHCCLCRLGMGKSAMRVGGGWEGDVVQCFVKFISFFMFVHIYVCFILSVCQHICVRFFPFSFCGGGRNDLFKYVVYFQIKVC